MNLDSYSTIVFDCDGVVLNSNRVKTDAFYQAALPYGTEAADALVVYHVANGGISRYVKFAYFLDSIVPATAPGRIPGRDGPALEDLLAAYAQSVRAGLLSCELADGLSDLRAITADARWLIASGGDQEELRSIFDERGLSDFFDGGIFGSPDTKDLIIGRELATGLIRNPALFLGDSRFDHEVAVKYRLEFVFLSAWTEMPEWDKYMALNAIRNASSIKELTTP